MDQFFRAKERTTAMAATVAASSSAKCLARLEEFVTPGAQERAVAGELERAAQRSLEIESGEWRSYCKHR
jgi:hypothetical protein